MSEENHAHVVDSRHYMEIDPDKVADLRSRVVPELEKFPDLYDSRDIERVKKEDWYLQRFILHTSVTKADPVEMVKSSLAFRKKYDINNLTEENVIQEFFDINALFPYNKDKNGNFILTLRVRAHKKRSDMSREIKQFFLRWVEHLDRKNNGYGIVLLFDCADAGISNLDLDFVRFVIDCFKFYYPHTLAYILVYDMPWVLNAAWKIIKGWLAKEAVDRIKFVNKMTIKDYIDDDQLSADMGGSDTHEFKWEEYKKEAIAVN